MIKVTYDSDVDAKYISIKDGEFFETKIINDWLFYDVNLDGDVLGIEILDSSKNEISITTLEDNLMHINYFIKSDKPEIVQDFDNKQKEYLISESFAVAA
jgi:uncharacterized protein YuzE